MTHAHEHEHDAVYTDAGTTINCGWSFDQGNLAGGELTLLTPDKWQAMGNDQLDSTNGKNTPGTGSTTNEVLTLTYTWPSGTGAGTPKGKHGSNSEYTLFDGKMPRLDFTQPLSATFVTHRNGEVYRFKSVTVGGTTVTGPAIGGLSLN